MIIDNLGIFGFIFWFCFNVIWMGFFFFFFSSLCYIKHFFTLLTSNSILHISVYTLPLYFFFSFLSLVHLHCDTRKSPFLQYQHNTVSSSTIKALSIYCSLKKKISLYFVIRTSSRPPVRFPPWCLHTGYTPCVPNIGTSWPAR